MRIRRGHVGHFAALAAVGLVLVTGLAGCAKEQETVDYTRPLPPGVAALRKLTDPAAMPDFAAGFTSDPAALAAAIDHSLVYLAHPSSESFYPVQDITHEQVVRSLEAFRELVLSARSPEELREGVLRRFDVYQSIGCDDRGTVLFTGYYQPIFEASPTPTAEFHFPLYKLPPDLVKGEDGLCRGRRLADGRIVPYPTRRGLETSGELKGLELVYLKDKFDAYICHVQGSALLHLTDGRWFEVGYAGKNAGGYASVGKLLMADGKIRPEEYSLDAIRQYFRAHPDEVDKYTWQNECFVFFQPTSGGPFGSLGVPVTAYRSLATDKLRDPSTGDYIFPRGSLTFVETTVPKREGSYLIGRPFGQFMLDQDTGGAIRAAGRADIYLGRGAEAGRIAGWTTATGKLFYLVLKSDETAMIQK